MHIEKIELRHIEMELVSPFTTSMGTDYEEEHIIVRVDSDAFTGWGECVVQANPFYNYETVKTAWHILEDFLIPVVSGKNISDVNKAISLFGGVRGHRMAKAGLEAALWDLFAKAKNISLSKILGGTKDKIDVGVSIGIQKSESELKKK